jgi:hypothetical protein
MVAEIVIGPYAPAFSLDATVRAVSMLVAFVRKGFVAVLASMSSFFRPESAT